MDFSVVVFLMSSFLIYVGYTSKLKKVAIWNSLAKLRNNIQENTRNKTMLMYLSVEPVWIYSGQFVDCLLNFFFNNLTLEYQPNEISI